MVLKTLVVLVNQWVLKDLQDQRFLYHLGSLCYPGTLLLHLVLEILQVLEGQLVLDRLLDQQDH